MILINAYAIISVSDILLDVVDAIFMLLSKGEIIMMLYEIVTGVLLAFGILAVAIFILRNENDDYDYDDKFENEREFNGDWW